MVVLAVALVLFVAQHRALLWQIESMTGRDLDGDGEIGEPETLSVPVELVDEEHGKLRRFDLPVGRDDLRNVAYAVLKNGKPFSRPGLAGVLSQGKYNRLAKEMEKRGLLAKKPGNKRVLTVAGKATLRRALD